MGMSDLEVRDLTRVFVSGGVSRRAVDGVSFTAPSGLLTGFVGGNGAGKTTTMRMIMGVLAITRGEVLFDGAPVTRHDPVSRYYTPRLPMVFCHVLSHPEHRKERMRNEWSERPPAERYAIAPQMVRAPKASVRDVTAPRDTAGSEPAGGAKRA